MDYLEELPEAKTRQTDHRPPRARAEEETTTSYQRYRLPQDHRDVLKLEGVTDKQRERDAENHETCIWKRGRGLEV